MGNKKKRGEKKDKKEEEEEEKDKKKKGEGPKTKEVHNCYPVGHLCA